MPTVVEQLQTLWGLKMIQLVFEPLFAYNDIQAVVEMKSLHTSPSKSKLP